MKLNEKKKRPFGNHYPKFSSNHIEFYIHIPNDGYRVLDAYFIKCTYYHGDVGNPKTPTPIKVLTRIENSQSFIGFHYCFLLSINFAKHFFNENSFKRRCI